MIFINYKLTEANKVLAEVTKYLRSPSFQYNKLDERAKKEYHELMARCEAITEIDKEE